MIAVLILAHKNFNQVRRLINTLKNDNVDVFMHVDKKAGFNQNDFKDINLIDKRFDIGWGDSSMVDATIYSLNYILNNKDYTHFILMSGQDYLIKPISDIVQFLDLNKEKNYITIGKIEDENTKNRYLKYRFKNKYLDKISVKLLKRKDIFENMTPCWGSQWWILNQKVIKYIVKKYNDEFNKKIKYTSCMDEVFIQTILYNSKFKDTIVCDNKYYIDWSNHKKGLNKGNPDVLTQKDFNKIIESNKFFCRKVDINEDEKLLDMLDEYRRKL